MKTYNINFTRLITTKQFTPALPKQRQLLVHLTAEVINNAEEGKKENLKDSRTDERQGGRG